MSRNQKKKIWSLKPIHIKKTAIAQRFRGLLPVVIDVETTGLQPATDGLLEIAAIFLWMDGSGRLHQGEKLFWAVEPFQGARVDPEALEVTGIDPGHPLRYAIPEQQALHQLFCRVKQALEKTGCDRAVLVGHNAWFDLMFLQAAVKRGGFKRVPFHSFTSFDTASLAAVALGETVLAKSLRKAKLGFDTREAHSALYDASKTAELFCYIVNKADMV